MYPSAPRIFWIREYLSATALLGRRHHALAALRTCDVVLRILNEAFQEVDVVQHRFGSVPSVGFVFFPKWPQNDHAHADIHDRFGRRLEGFDLRNIFLV